MAKKNEIDTLSPVDETPADIPVETVAEKTPVTNTVSEPEHTPPAEAAVTEPENEQIAPDAPQHLQALAAAHRVPGWQAAALSRLMGWEEGKMVTDAEYTAALGMLGSRKQGGGRR